MGQDPPHRTVAIQRNVCADLSEVFAKRCELESSTLLQDKRTGARSLQLSDLL
jgi:hypothetical protein